MGQTKIGQKQNESLEIHLPCPSPMCMGTLYPSGVIKYESFYKCCICEKEFNAREVNNGRPKHEKYHK